ncbi:MAG: hypothetical protein IPH55_17245 [Betaproteobacteria bacterium]|nr:hypothetical protein [Betaproteobacteria bacterium]
MTKFKQVVLGAAMAMAFSAPALAAPINVGGVIWDPDNPNDFNSTSGSIIQVAGVPLTGWVESTSSILILRQLSAPDAS